METLLLFLTVRLRQNGMTVNEFCGRIGISRQKFYRFVKEPHRFPAESVRAIISVLSLDAAEVKQLESYLDPQQTGPRPQKPEDNSPNLSDYGDLIENLFRHKLSAELAPDLDTIEFSRTDRYVTMVSPASFARILAGMEDSADPADTVSGSPAAQEHEYEMTLYNCVPSIADYSQKRIISTSRYIQHIASIVKELEDVLIPVSAVRIRIRHFMTNRRREQMIKSDLTDKAAMSFQLQVLNTLLPLLSTVEDYAIEGYDDPNTVWTSRGDFCTIRHTCRHLTEMSNAQTGSFPSGPVIRTDYYILAFSENGDCRACRLGSDEISHIYRFLSPDGRGTCCFTEKKAVDNPSLDLYQRFKDHQIIMICPDLYFDDIPPHMWMTLYKELQNRSDKELYERAFRKLIDPYDQYTFLSFDDLVQAVLKTMEQRLETAKRMGNCVICHPSGLLNLVRTGMISDLAIGSDGCTGSSRSSTPLRFPAPIIRELLEMIRSNILWRLSSGVRDPLKCGRINYYILHPQFPVPEISFHIYGGCGVIPLYIKGRHKHILANMFDSPAAATILFDYVRNEMIGKRGEKLGSDILSDEHSLALIDKLILMLDEGGLK